MEGLRGDVTSNCENLVESKKDIEINPQGGECASAEIQIDSGIQEP